MSDIQQIAALLGLFWVAICLWRMRSSLLTIHREHWGWNTNVAVTRKGLMVVFWTLMATIPFVLFL